MDNQHKLIKGYRDLSLLEIDLLNKIKAVGNEQLYPLLQQLESMGTVDKRCLAIGKTEIQKGFMFILRSIAQPTTYV